MSLLKFVQDVFAIKSNCVAQECSKPVECSKPAYTGCLKNVFIDFYGDGTETWEGALYVIQDGCDYIVYSNELSTTKMLDNHLDMVEDEDISEIAYHIDGDKLFYI